MSNDSNKEKCLIEITIAGIPTIALVDSGSTVTLIDKKFSSNLEKLDLKIYPTNLKLKVVNKKTVMADQAMIAPFEFPGKKLTHEAIVLDDLAYACIIGLDCLKKIGMIVSFGNLSWCWNTSPSVWYDFYNSGINFNLGECNLFEDEDFDSEAIEKALLEAPIDSEKKEKLRSLIFNYKCVFSTTPGLTKSAEHYVDTGNSMPIACPPYRYSPIRRR